jgi:type VI secretion system Hcp family effector
MPGNSFIRFEGVKPGESLQKTHPGIDGWVEISDWSWDIEAEHSAFKGTGSAVGKPTPGTLSFSHYFDSTSPEIMNRIVRGTHFTKVVLQMLKQIGTDVPKVYFEILMGSAFITKISTKGVEDGSMTQDIELVFKEIIVSYKAQKNVGGGLDVTKEFAWDIPSMQNSAPSIASATTL